MNNVKESIKKFDHAHAGNRKAELKASDLIRIVEEAGEGENAIYKAVINAYKVGYIAGSK